MSLLPWSAANAQAIKKAHTTTTGAGQVFRRRHVQGTKKSSKFRSLIALGGRRSINFDKGGGEAMAVELIPQIWRD